MPKVTLLLFMTHILVFVDSPRFESLLCYAISSPFMISKVQYVSLFLSDLWLSCGF
jgi:hypothetical protein